LSLQPELATFSSPPEEIYASAELIKNIEMKDQIQQALAFPTAICVSSSDGDVQHILSITASQPVCCRTCRFPMFVPKPLDAARRSNDEK